MFSRCRDGGDPGAGAGPGRGGRPAEPRGPDRVQHRLHAQTLQDRRRDRMALHQQGNNSTGERDNIMSMSMAGRRYKNNFHDFKQFK